MTDTLERIHVKPICGHNTISCSIYVLDNLEQNGSSHGGGGVE